MPAKRNYSVRGSKDCAVLAGVCFFLCTWAIKDAWFPSDKVLKKHPAEVIVTFETAGTVDAIHVGVGDSVGEKQLLLNLHNTRAQADYKQAREDYVAAKKKCAALKGQDETATAEARQLMTETQATVNTLYSSVEALELMAPSKGEVKEVLVATHSVVEAGDMALILDPKDHFYLFNKSLAILCFFGFWVCLAIQLLGH